MIYDSCHELFIIKDIIDYNIILQYYDINIYLNVK